MKKIAIFVLAAFVFSGLAMASITPAFDGVTGPTAGLFTWSYTIAVDANESLNPPVNTGVTCGAGPGTCPQGVFFTFYDIRDLVSAGTTGAGWGSQIQMTGLTPASQFPTVPDSGLSNVSYFYTGAPVSGPLTQSGFSFTTDLSGASAILGFYSFSATTNSPVAPDSGQGRVMLPSGTGVPEPASIVLIGGGLIGLAFLGRKRLVRK